VRLALAASRATLTGVADTPVLLRAAEEAGVDTRLLDWRGGGWGWAQAVLLHAPWDYTEDVEGFTGWLTRQAVRVPVHNPAARALSTTRKSSLLDLAAAGVPLPRTHLLRGGQPVEVDVLRADLGASAVVVKPAVGAGGRRLLRLAGVDEVPSCPLVDPGGAAVEDLLVQAFVPTVLTGGEHSVVLIAGQVSHVVRKTPAAGQFRVQASYGGTEARVEVDAAAAAMVRALQPWTTGLAYARVDYVTGDDGQPLLMELELTEPDLFLRHRPQAARDLIEHVREAPHA